MTKPYFQKVFNLVFDRSEIIALEFNKKDTHNASLQIYLRGGGVLKIDSVRNDEKTNEIEKIWQELSSVAVDLNY